jgi:ankyrin repeat protein
LASYNLITAILSSNLAEVQTRVQANPDLVRKKLGPRNWSPLMYLSYGRVKEAGDQKNSLAIATFLIEHGADVNDYYVNMETYHFSVLTGAMGEGEGGLFNQPPHQYSRSLAKIFLDAGADPNDSQGLYNTMFTDSGDYWLELLISYGLNRNSQVNWEVSDNKQKVFDYLLANAVSKNKTERVKYLLDQGADADAVCSYSDRKVLTIAIVNQHKEIENLLIKSGASPVELTMEQEFMLAVATGNNEGIAALVKSSPELLTKIDLIQGATPDTLQLLIDLGFDLNFQLDNGRTLCHLLAIHGKLDPLKYLMERGADIELRDKDFSATVVAFAHFNNQYEVRDYLLERSNNTLELSACGRYDRLKRVMHKKPELAKQISASGNTPLHVVCNWLGADANYDIREKIMDLLIDNGADINALNNDGLTPLDLYQLENDDDNIDLMLERGAVSHQLKTIETK